MGFLVTTAIFFLIGLIACFCTRLCCNFHITLLMTATVSCWMMWAIVYLAQMKPLIVPILNEGE